MEASTVSRTAVEKPFEVDEQLMWKQFGRDSFAVRHKLMDHPLLQLERLAELADSLPPDQAEHTDSDAPDILPDGGVQDESLTAGDVVRGIETNGKWIVLKRCHTDPEYQALADWILDGVHSEQVEEEGGRISSEVFIIVSSPESNVPSHFDPEYNMLFQMRGTKDVTVGTFPDAETENTEALRYYGGGHRNISDMPANAKVYPMGPGDGVHIPPHAPHMVKNGPTFSISLSIAFYTRGTAQMVDAYSMNARLSKMHMTPAHLGEHPGRDKVKAGIWKSMRGVRNAVKKLIPGR
jgi:hypothetical protein